MTRTMMMVAEYMGSALSAVLQKEGQADAEPEPHPHQKEEP